MLARAVSFNVAGQAGGFLVSFAASIMLARLLGPSDRGMLAMMSIVAILPVAFAGLGLAGAVQYFGSRRETPQHALLGNSLAFGLLLGLVFTPVFWLLRDPLAGWFTGGRGSLLWVLASILVPLTFLANTTSGQLCGRLQFGLWNALLVASRVLTLACVGLLVGLASLGVAGGLVAAAAGSLVITVVSAAAVLGRRRPRLDLSLFRREVAYGLRAQVGLLFHLLNYRFDLLVLGLFATLANVGYYAVAQTLAELAIYLGTAFQISVLPLVSRLDGDARQSDMSRAAVRHHGLLAMIVIAANGALAPLILHFGYGAAFGPALVPFFVLLPGMWFLSTGNMITGDLQGRGRPGLTSVLKGAAALLTVALDFALIPRYGIVGAASASCAAYTLFGIAALVALSRLAGLSVRELVLPTRGDLAAYRRAPAVLAGALRRRGVPASSQPFPA